MVEECLEYGSEEMALKALGEGWVGEEAVALALYCFLRYPDDYAKTVRRGANTNGDSDAIACIAGGIGSTRLGVDAIPVHWRRNIEEAEHLDDLEARVAVKKDTLRG